MSNRAHLESPGGPPDVVTVSFAAAATVWDPGVLATALSEADKQFLFLSEGRVLRGVEMSKVARRMSSAASRAALRPRLMRVFHTAVYMLVHYSRLMDDISLRQLADEAGLSPSASRKLGADLAELSALGLLLYRPGKGRGRMSMIGVPARFVGDILLRLQREGRRTSVTSTPESPDGDNASDGGGETPAEVPTAGDSTAHDHDHRSATGHHDCAAQRRDNAVQNSPGRGVVSGVVPHISLSEKPPAPAGPPAPDPQSEPHATATPTPCGETEWGRDNVDPVRSRDVDWVLDRMPSRLRADPDPRSRRRQAKAIRSALAHEFRRGVLLELLSTSIPPVVHSPAGFVEFRIGRLLASGESPRRFRERLERHRDRERAGRSAVLERLSLDARWADRIHAEVPAELLAGLVSLATERLRQPAARAYVTARALAGAVSTLLRESTPGQAGARPPEGADVADLAKAVLAGHRQLPRELSPRVAAAMAAAHSLEAAIAVFLTPPNDLETDADLPERVAEPQPMSCIACGVTGAAVATRPELPIGVPTCEACLAASRDEDYVLELDEETPLAAGREPDNRSPLGASAEASDAVMLVEAIGA